MMAGKAKLTLKELEEWRSESAHAEIMVDYILSLHGQISKLIKFADITLDDEGLFFGEYIYPGSQVERNINMAILLIVGTSGLLDPDGILSYW